MELITSTGQLCRMKFPGTIRILQRESGSINGANLTLKVKMNTFGFVSHVSGMHGWEHSGSQTRSASSGMCWGRWHGRGIHHESINTNK